MALVAVGQICSTSSMEHNLKQCQFVIRKAVEKGAKVVFFPEASDYIGSSPDESKKLCQSTEQSLFMQGLQSEAKKCNLCISVGVHEPSDDPHSKRIKNTLLYIDANGLITQRYQKVHLFDMEIEGGPAMKESNLIEPGNEMLKPFDTPAGKLGSCICFDLRFPEIALHAKRLGAEVILYPSAFTPKTGQAHWMALLRARAIECTAYVIAAAQVGAHSEKRSSYGHSVIIDPWGEVVAELGGEKKDEPEVLFAELDLEKVRKLRREMPLMRRTDVYPEI
ncbi:hypothetical protein LTR62_008161 [Meristemomyces frigidus]|uniref:CN hydrolase domain-containing protein n=1 Tax=Meristemomyces frigidus TaxID=1508187 RepID=A0AAN7TDU9_9PEZI|nr:hypothetical protein LTR62_008161 [Meristemomyces frigidus]